MEHIDNNILFMYESIDIDNPSHYTREWFFWTNSVFCELVMDYLGFRIKMK